MNNLTRLFLPTCIILLAGLTACAPTTITLSPETPSVEITTPSQTPRLATATEPPTPTAIATAISIETPTPTETPRMTLEDWKEVFSGPYLVYEGKTYDFESAFKEENLAMWTDPDQVRALPLGSGAITLLNPNGEITIYVDPNVAAERVEKGAVALVDQDGPTSPEISACLSLLAATLQYQKGNKNIYVQFNENSIGEFPYNSPYGITINLNLRVLQITLDDGTIISPIMPMPKHFKVTHANVVEKRLTLDEAGIVITDPDKWLDQVLKAGYDAIVIYPR